MKQSGLGLKGGSQGIAEYTTTQYIAIVHPYAAGPVAARQQGEHSVRDSME
ncbi:hypothetical protein J2X42_004690 [Arthrobacter sp. BE255]|nr:hypothetical protein [Arthrobacter sp. BE255]